MTQQQHRNALSPGRQVGNYRIEKVLGQGGFGITYLGRDDRLERYVAIKEYFPVEFSSRDQDGSVHPQSEPDRDVYSWGLERFLAEGKTLAKFKHPNIVRVIDYLEQNNTAYIIMEYEHGSDLQGILKQKKTLPPEEILEVFLPLLDGLSQVHKEGFIHRDIKPANIFIREDGSPVLIDFGSARQGLASRTRTLTTLVSPGYAPFEQYNADGPGKQGPWTDVYALGASMYRALFGRSPLDAVSRAEERVAGRADPFMSATMIGKDHYPLPLLAAIDRALRFLPEERPRDIADWLQSFEHGGQVPAPQDTEGETVRLDPEAVTAALPEAGGKELTGQDAGRYDMKLAVTRFLVFGMLTLWAFTSYQLGHHLAGYAGDEREAKLCNRLQYLFPGVYIFTLLLVLSWIVPNVFSEHFFGASYILKIVFISAVIFYLNTLAFVAWYMRMLKRVDRNNLARQADSGGWGDDQAREAGNQLVSRWEKIDNNVMLFLIVTLPIIFSPYVCAKLFYTSSSQVLILALPVIVMLAGGLFHVWGTRLLINSWNEIIARKYEG